MYNVTRNRRNRQARYLGYDANGQHEWTPKRLDAIRFASKEDIVQSCGIFIRDGAAIVKADPWDGHYECYRGFEIQVFRDDLKGKPGGHRWRHRIGTLDNQRPYEYHQGRLGYTTPEAALKAAKSAINRKVGATV